MDRAEAWTIVKYIFFSGVYGWIAWTAISHWTKEDHPYEISILSSYQKEDRFLREWLDFHLVQGVQRFYLYNNTGTDKTGKILEPYIEFDIVEILPKKDDHDAFAHVKGESKWVAMIGVNDFLFPTKEENLIEFIQKYGNSSEILVNRQVFENREDIPEDKFLIEKVTLQTPLNHKLNKECRCIVRPEAIKSYRKEKVLLYPWMHSINPRRRIVNSKFKRHPVQVDLVRINHYLPKDQKISSKGQQPNTEILRFLPSMYEIKQDE